MRHVSGQRAIDTVQQSYGPVPIRIGAQSRLEAFYASFGFVRDGDDLHTGVRISMTDAALGATVTAPGLLEDVELEVPAGTQPGTVRVVHGGEGRVNRVD